jgi:hypothetical protein
MFDTHELVKTILAAIEKDATLPKVAEAIASALQTRVGHDVVSYLRGKLVALLPAGVLASIDAEKLDDLVYQALDPSASTDDRVRAILAALRAPHDRPEAVDLVVNTLNPLRHAK